MSVTKDYLYGGSYAVARGAARSIPFSPVTPTSVVGQTFRVRIIDPLGNDAEVDVPHASLSITTATGVVTATITAAMTTAWTANSVEVWLWRTDSGAESEIAWIILELFDAGVS